MIPGRCRWRLLAGRFRPIASVIAPVFTAPWASRFWAWKPSWPTAKSYTRGRWQKHSAGLNLNSLLIGGEGCFGIITEATIRIFPKPDTRLFRGYLFASFEQGYGAIQEMFQRRLRPALLDFGDDAEKHGGSILYLVFEGNQELTAVEERQAVALCRPMAVRNCPAAMPSSFGASATRSPGGLHAIAASGASAAGMVFIAIGSMSLCRARKSWLSAAPPRRSSSAMVCVYKKAAYGCSRNFSPCGWAPKMAPSPTPQLALEEAIEELLRLVQQIGGSMEYTHGVGVKLAPLMAEEHGYGLQVMRQIKKTSRSQQRSQSGENGLVAVTFLSLVNV